MSDLLQLDIDLHVPGHLRELAVLKAIQENPENAPKPDITGNMILAVNRQRLWKNGKTLRICFLEGDPVVIERVIETAQKWTSYANLTFNFGDFSDADLRIAFKPGWSASYVGTDALVIPREEGTINFGWLAPDSPQDVYSNVVLHEFGHAIGCIHEHQTPDAGIQWNKEAVYEYYQNVVGWTKRDIDHNVFYTYDRNTSNHTVFDPLSIMVYPILKEHTVNAYEVKQNTVLSETDKSFIAQIYPKGI
ncbi:MAG: hypothetical protein GY862_10005 [Gammaproteobacteria bacterium]|nr:hypothetical protein [Gammaproteobacteria bacterium]